MREHEDAHRAGAEDGPGLPGIMEDVFSDVADVMRRIQKILDKAVKEVKK